MKRLPLLVVAALVLGTVLFDASPANAWSPGVKRQAWFKFCFNSTVSANRAARFRNGLTSWSARATLAWAETSCSDSGALTVRVQSIDGFKGTVAETHFNLAGSPVDVTFDSGEVWNDGTDAPTSSEADFWGVAAHELGHIWGLDHDCTSCVSPEGEYNTMDAVGRLYASSGVVGAEQRNLTSDDEAGARWVQDLSFMPNRGFERSSDSISPVETVPAFYWKRNGNEWPRACNDGLAYEGSCHVNTSTVGAVIWQTVTMDFNYPLHGLIKFWARDGWPTSGRLHVIVKDLGSTSTLANRTFSIPGGAGPWTAYSFTFTPSYVRTLYEVSITNEVAAALIRLDFVRFEEVQ